MEPHMLALIASSLGVVGGHFVLSHPLRAPLVRALGETGFAALYSLVAFATLGGMIVAFRAIGPGGATLWNGGAALPWSIASLLTLIALTLLLGALKGNPALPMMPSSVVANARATGVFAVSRHPLMWGFALWALAHMLVSPSPRTLVVAASVLVLALVGAALQDAKKEKLLGAAWKGWEAQTSYWPRLAGLAQVSPLLWIAGGVAWAAITWAHMPLASVPAGIWRWLG